MSLTYTSNINKIKFYLPDTEEIINDSFVNVTSYDLFRDSLPKPKGVNDIHLGTTDHNYRCGTCLNNKKDCIGHDGHIILNYPVISPICINELRKWIKLVCFECGRPIVAEQSYIKFPKSKRLKEASKIARSINFRKCTYCDAPHPKITKDRTNQLILYAEKSINDINKEKLYPHIIKTIFERIADEYVIKLGLKVPEGHPSRFILEAIKVPTVVIRPDVRRLGGGKSKNDNLTTLVQSIVKYNDTLPPTIPEKIDNPKLDKNIYDLNNFYYNMIRGSCGSKIISSGTKQLTSIAARLKGKEGRFRLNQMGKRIRNSARSIIVCDISIKPTELGIPQKFAKNMQISETVQESNKQRLLIYFNNGRNKYPGCTSIVKRITGTEHNIEKIKDDFTLEIGDVINRDIITGDVVLFNRQPSLMPSNITAHRAIVIEDPSIFAFRLNVIACKWYNADFDGDAMNMYINSTMAEQNEIEQISSSKNFFMSHAKSNPIIGQIDDSIIGSFELTRSNVRLDKYHAMLLFARSSYLPKFNKKLYTGWDIISFLLEETPINYRRPPTYYIPEYAPYIPYTDDEKMTIIENGIMKSGIIDKKAVGFGSMGSIYHIIHNKYNVDMAMDVIYNMQQAVIWFLYQKGFTVGIMDLLLTQKSLDKIHKNISSIINKSELLTKKYVDNKLIPPIGKTIDEFYEQQSIEILRHMDEFISPIFESIDIEKNNLFRLVMSGSKGKINHMYHIMTAIGQVIINGDRIKQNLAFKRSMPYFRRFEHSPQSRGYIPDSYIVGIDMPSFISVAQMSRFDLISKALSTSVTGDQNRKSVKSLETVIVDNYRFCMKGQNIVQYTYGENNLDTRFVERVKFPTVLISDAEFDKKYKEEGFENEYKIMLDDRKKYREIFLNFEEMNFSHPIEDTRFMPFNAQIIINDVLSNASIKRHGNLKELVEMVNGFIKKLHIVMFNEAIKIAPPQFIKNITWLPSMLIRSYLYPAALKKMNKTILKTILSRIFIKYQQALIEYGAAVGVIAAESFSEPLTQYMLDAHHKAASGGVSKSEMTKVKEILGVRSMEKLSNPSMFLELRNVNEEMAQKIANNIEVLKVKQFVKYYQIFYEKFGEPIHPKYIQEKKIINDFIKYNPLIPPPTGLLKWCIRMSLNKTTLILKNISLECIINNLRELFPYIYIVYTSENSPEVILRIYLRNIAFAKRTTKAGNIINEDVIKKYTEQLLDTVIRGIDGIIQAAPIKLIRNKIEPTTGKIVRDTERFGIKTVGTNIFGVLQNKHINPQKIQTDSITETYDVLGIEAARQKVISQLRTIGEGDVNHTHYTLYADEMTYTGRVTSIERGGLTLRERDNILLRLGFSSPIQSLEEAATNTMTDNINGITAKLLLGTTPKVGTIYNSFHINSEILRDNVKTGDDYLDQL